MVFQRDAYVSEAGVGIEKRFKQNELPGHLAHEAASASSKVAPLLAATRRWFVSLGQEGRPDVSPKRKDEAVDRCPSSHKRSL